MEWILEICSKVLKTCRRITNPAMHGLMIISVISTINYCACQDTNILFSLNNDSINFRKSDYNDSIVLIIEKKQEITIFKPKQSDHIFDFETAYYKLDTLTTLYKINTMLDSYGFIYIPIVLDNKGELYAIGKSFYCDEEQFEIIRKALLQINFKKLFFVDIENLIFLNLTVNIGNRAAPKFIPYD